MFNAQDDKYILCKERYNAKDKITNKITREQEKSFTLSKHTRNIFQNQQLRNRFLPDDLCILKIN